VARPRREGLFIVWDGIGTNITERKKMERELKAAKDRLQALGDNIPGGTLFQFVRDTRTRRRRISYVSATWEAVTGIPADIVLADITKLYSTIPSDEFPDYLQAMDESALNLTDVNLEIHFKDRLMHMVARPNREGTLIFWNGIMTDITERKNKDIELSKYRDHLEQLVNERTAELHTALEEIQASNEELFVTNENLNEKNIQLAEEMTARMEAMRQLEESENKLMSFFAQSFDGILIVDNEGSVIEWNQEQEHITGISREKAIGKYCWDLFRNLIPGENAEKTVDQFRTLVLSLLESAKEGKKYTDETEFEICLPCEGTKYVVVTTFPMKHEDQYYLGQVIRDITRQKINDKELEKYRTQLENMVEQRTKELILAKEKAEESDKLKSAFLANMSHEIRTPLNGIVGFLQFLNSDNLSPERRREYIDIVNNSSMQLAQIIDDIIDVSKIEANQMNINPAPVNLNDLMNELRMFFETYLQSKNKEHVELILDDSGFIDNCIVYMDSMRLRQILTNLIGNAVKFTEKGYIRFGYRKSAPDFLEFVVEDSGIGLRDDQQEVIFERFRQAEIENRNHYGGTGLGLTISKSLVEMKGGRMWVESSEGKGASFYFTISYLPVLQQDMKLFTEMPDNNPFDGKPFTGKSILFIEPIALKFKYYDKLFTETGASVIHTKNLKKWRELMQTDIHFDVVITDASLLDYEDLDEISQIINIRPNLPVVLIVSDKKREKYMRLVRGKLCKTAVEIPVVYADVMKILEKYAK
jgi:PAS domain S-box-containing protein